MQKSYKLASCSPCFVVMEFRGTQNYEIFTVDQVLLLCTRNRRRKAGGETVFVLQYIPSIFNVYSPAFLVKQVRLNSVGLRDTGKCLPKILGTLLSHCADSDCVFHLSSSPTLHF